MKTPITPFKMPLDLKDAAKKQADKEGLSLAQLVYKAIREHIEKYKCDNCGSTNIHSLEYYCNDCEEWGTF